MLTEITPNVLLTVTFSECALVINLVQVIHNTHSYSYLQLQSKHWTFVRYV